MVDAIILLDDGLPSSTLVHAKMYHILAQELRAQGYDVVIFLPGGLLQGSWIKETVYRDVRYWRFRAPVIRSKSKVLRLFYESLLSPLAVLSLLCGGKGLVFKRVINHAPTIFFGGAACLLRRNGAKVHLIQRDFFPQWAIESNLIKGNSVLAKYLKIIEQINYRSSDVIWLQSPKNFEVFDRLAPQQKYKCQLLYNWTSENKLFSGSGAGEDYINSLGLSGKTVFFYGGNMGHAQHLTQIVQLAEWFKNRKVTNSHFLFVGSGHEAEKLDDYCKSKKLDNVTFRPAVNQELYSQLLEVVDVGLISLHPTQTAHNFPGKLLGYMEAGLPIIGCVNPGNDVAELYNESNAGVISDEGLSHWFLDRALQIASCAETRRAMGVNSRELLGSLFSVEVAARKLMQ